MRAAFLLLCNFTILSILDANAQVKSIPRLTGITTQKSVVIGSQISKIENFKNSNADYSVWKVGKNIPTNNFGGLDSMFNVVVGDCWSVSYDAYSLRPKEGLITVSARLQNKKKYMVTVNYSTSSYLKIHVHFQYSSDKHNDYDVNYLQEDMDFYPDKKWPGSFSFIVEPEITKIGGAPMPVDYPTLALIGFNIPEVRIKESGKTQRDYFFNYMGITIKEIQ